MFINLTPFIPLSFKGEGEDLFLKGLRPFKLPLLNNLGLHSEGWDWWQYDLPEAFLDNGAKAYNEAQNVEQAKANALVKVPDAEGI
ncbi:hypothetical protein M1N59_01205 [Dehalococcoidales bacterium]|nr:hypothetical protein [Dehalococcoidales bacterium]